MKSYFTITIEFLTNTNKNIKKKYKKHLVNKIK